MPIKRVGHVVLKMRDLEKAKSFYNGVLGMEIALDMPRAVFFRFNDYHHDIAVFKTGDDAEEPKDNQVGLMHVALVCDSDETVRGYYDKCKELGLKVSDPMDYDVAHGFYVRDPEDNEIEIYADTPYDWRTGGLPSRSKPFDMESVPSPAQPV